MATLRFASPRLVLAAVLLILGALAAACGDAATPTTAPAVAPAATTAPAATSATGGAATGAEIAVTLNDNPWSVDPKAISTTAGHQKFVVTNAGKFKHNFTIMVNGQKVKTANLDAGAKATLETDLGAGTYDTLCDIPGHADQGMKGTLDVK
jgi:uncharacterized cupredoxin-like copper-binding protein